MAPPANRLLLIQGAAGLAQWIDIFLIFTVPVFEWSSTPGQMALVAACLAAPSFALGPFVGAYLDRGDPRKALAAAVHARIVFSLLIAFAPDLGTFACLVLLKGFGNLFYWPSSFILTHRVVDADERASYYSNLGLCDQTSKILTPLAVGAIALIIGSQKAFILVAAVSFPGAALLPGLFSRMPAEGPGNESSRRPASVPASGFPVFKSFDRNLIASIVLGVGVSLTLAIYDPHLSSFLNHAGFDAQAYSCSAG